MQKVWKKRISSDKKKEEDDEPKLAVDRVKVADGKMTKEEFAKKWRSKK